MRRRLYARLHICVPCSLCEGEDIKVRQLCQISEAAESLTTLPW